MLFKWFTKKEFFAKYPTDNTEKETNMARIITLDGRVTLFNDGVVVGTYARARDAKRGAARRGLVLA